MNPWDAFDDSLKERAALHLRRLKWALWGRSALGTWKASRGGWLVSYKEITRPSLALLVRAIEQIEEEARREGAAGEEDHCDCDDSDP